MYITRVHLAFLDSAPSAVCVRVACVADRWGHGGDGIMAAGPHVRGRKGEGEGNGWGRSLIKRCHHPVPHGSEGRERERADGG